jgi:hypothetical protein
VSEAMQSSLPMVQQLVKKKIQGLLEWKLLLAKQYYNMHSLSLPNILYSKVEVQSECNNASPTRSIERKL